MQVDIYIRPGPLLSGLGKSNSQTTTRIELLTRGTHLVGIPPLRLARQTTCRDNDTPDNGR